MAVIHDRAARRTDDFQRQILNQEASVFFGVQLLVTMLFSVYLIHRILASGALLAHAIGLLATIGLAVHVMWRFVHIVWTTPRGSRMEALTPLIDAYTTTWNLVFALQITILLLL